MILVVRVQFVHVAMATIVAPCVRSLWAIVFPPVGDPAQRTADSKVATIASGNGVPAAMIPCTLLEYLRHLILTLFMVEPQC